MTREEKQLLLKDLCARLPYGLKVNIRDIDHPAVVQAIYSDLDVLVEDIYRYSLLFECKPYLRPMSSMTEEEEEEYELLIDCSDHTYFKTSDKVIDWLNAHHFDYRIDPSTDKTLIESDLAIEAPKDMYK